MVKFLRWLKAAVSTGNETEISIDKKLYEFRAGQPHFNGISFDTIAGYKAHGAIVHYEATPETDIPLKPEGMLLLDSGGAEPCFHAHNARLRLPDGVLRHHRRQDC